MNCRWPDRAVSSTRITLAMSREPPSAADRYGGGQRLRAVIQRMRKRRNGSRPIDPPTSSGYADPVTRRDPLDHEVRDAERIEIMAERRWSPLGVLDGPSFSGRRALSPYRR
jgi:hypothetical protein